MAQIAVIVRSAAFNTRRSAEALRMSVGQTLRDHQVHLILAGDAVYILGNVAPDRIGGGNIQLPLETLRMLRQSLFAEAESLDERGIETLPKDVRRVSRQEIARMLAECDVVIPW